VQKAQQDNPVLQFCAIIRGKTHPKERFGIKTKTFASSGIMRFAGLYFDSKKKCA
jgi:hypothetical protein